MKFQCFIKLIYLEDDVCLMEALACVVQFNRTPQRWKSYAVFQPVPGQNFIKLLAEVGFTFFSPVCLPLSRSIIYFSSKLCCYNFTVGIICFVIEIRSQLHNILNLGFFSFTFDLCSIVFFYQQYYAFSFSTAKAIHDEIHFWQQLSGQQTAEWQQSGSCWRYGQECQWQQSYKELLSYKALRIFIIYE